MKKKRCWRTLFLLMLGGGLTLTSCFKDEPANAECDIVKAWIHYDHAERCTWNLTDTLLNLSSSEPTILFKVKPNTDRTALAPRFQLTPGATIVPADGSVHDFTNDTIVYTVTSEDKQWQRIYRVAVVEEHHTQQDTLRFDFERFYLFQAENSTAKYYVWSDLKEDGTEANNWASGNAGFKISNMTALPDDYPTTPLAEGKSGYGVKLTTRKTGPIAASINKRMAAGNLFLGSFDANYALTNTLKTTRFGVAFDRKPTRLRGFYKYTPGEVYQDVNGKEIAGVTDCGTIYAVFYLNHDEDGNAVVLDGSDVQTNRHIVAKAVLKEMKTTDEWTAFDVPFDYFGNEVNEELLNTFGYNLTVVFSSSKDGDLFQGAVGSTLCVDEVSVVCEKEDLK